MRNCKNCKKPFNPIRPLQNVCSLECAIELSNKKSKKDWKVKKSKLKEAIKTKKDYLNDLQAIFNTFIRLRDKPQPCISCNSNLPYKYDAGHFFSVGLYPELRFNENNCHAQCIYCNQHNHGNLIKYREGLIKRIGLDQFEKLESLVGIEVHLTISEIKDKIVYYKQQIKLLK